MIATRWAVALGALALAAGGGCAARQTGEALGARPVGTVISVLPSVEDTCTVVVKQPTIKAYAGMRLTFTVLNFCSSEVSQDEVVVRVGNFRRAGTTGAPNTCTAAMYPDTETPIFRQSDLERHRTARVSPSNQDTPRQGRIGLTLVAGGELPKPDPGKERLEYDFDVCLGDSKVDPRLIIER